MNGMSPPGEFPHVVCWNSVSRSSFLDKLALSVAPPVFRATHHPSPINHLDSGGNLAKFTELELLESFVNAKDTLDFHVIEGDPGTGKSHLILWVHQELERRIEERQLPWQVVLIPRSSANLADVIRHIIGDFDGENAQEIRRKLQSSHGLTHEGAMTRVLDELEFVLRPEHHTVSPLDDDLSPEDEELLAYLPTFLHSQAIRDYLRSEENGIIARLAQHVMGTRERLEEDVDLSWTPDDLNVKAAVWRNKGDVEEIASALSADPGCREKCARLLNLARDAAFHKLLGLGSGDLIAVTKEIRRQLLEQGRELIVLIEDLSITHGLAQDLIEALLVPRRETGTGVTHCRLRSMVGVTRDDARRLRENVRDRTNEWISFDVGVDETPTGISREEIIEFASRYLNVVRFESGELDDWYNRNEGSLPSYCTSVECPNQSVCHQAFGNNSDRGLYPLSPDALIRLYEHRVESSAKGTIAKRAFNPRKMIEVIHDVLRFAEDTIRDKRFPSDLLIKEFRLSEIVTAEMMLRIEQQVPRQKQEVANLLELYADGQSRRTRPGVAAAFDLPEVDWGKALPPEPSQLIVNDPQETMPVQRAKAPEKDEFERWFKDGLLEDNWLNRWRTVLRDAVRAVIDWDAEDLASVKTHFKNTSIRFEGQTLGSAKGDVTVVVQRGAREAMALRGLVRRFELTPEEKAEESLLYAAALIDDCANQIRAQLRKLQQEPGEPLGLAAQSLAIGALMRGNGRARMSSDELWEAILEEWPQNVPEELESRSPAWKELWRAFQYPRTRTSDAAKYPGNIVRNLLVRHLSYAKGSAVGSVVNPQPVLEALKTFQSQGFPASLMQECENWVTYSDVRDLAKDINLRIADAIREERTRCEKWLEDVNRLVGDATPSDWVKVLEPILAAAASANVLTGGKTSLDLVADLKEFAKRKFASTRKAVERAIEASDQITQLQSLGQVDARLMQDSLDMLERTERVITGAHGKAQMLIDALGGASQSPEQLQEEIDNLLRGFVDALSKLTQTEVPTEANYNE